MSKYMKKRKHDESENTKKRVHDILRKKYRGAFPDGIAYFGYHYLYAYGPIEPEV